MGATGVVRIVSDGLPHHTQVVVDGQPIPGLMSVRWEITADTLAKATIVVDNVELDTGLLNQLDVQVRDGRPRPLEVGPVVHDAINNLLRLIEEVIDDLAPDELDAYELLRLIVPKRPKPEVGS